MLLDKVDLSGVPSVCRVIQLGDELEEVRGDLEARCMKEHTALASLIRIWTSEPRPGESVDMAETVRRVN